MGYAVLPKSNHGYGPRKGLEEMDMLHQQLVDMLRKPANM